MAGKSSRIDLEHFMDNPDEIFDLLSEMGSDLEIDEGEDGDDYLNSSILSANSIEDDESIPPERTGFESDCWDSDDDIPLSHFQKATWKKDAPFQSIDDSVNDNMPSDCEILSPWEYFKKYLNDDFFQMGAEYTVRYYMQQTGKPVNISCEDIKKFFGLHAIMGATKFPTIHMYWNANYVFPLIANVMPRDKFYLLRVNFHVVDNLAVSDEIKKENKLWKVQPVIDLVRNRCCQINRMANESYSIDEQMIPFLGRCPVRQYVKNKPRPVGLKNFVLTTSTGIVLDFEIYQGTTTNLSTRELGLGPSVILRLVETIPEGSSVFFDRYFSTVPLMEKLLEININGTATIMANRIKGCEFQKDKEMNRGDCEQFVRSNKNICVTKWMDTKSVLMISTAYGTEPQCMVQRWDKTRKARVDVPCPKVVKIYNQKMGGVDTCDQMLEYYRSFYKTRKWPLKVILHLFDLAIVNSWQEYRKDHAVSKSKSKRMKLLEFRLKLGEYLISGTKKCASESEDNNKENEEMQPEKKKKRHAALPCEDKRFDGFEHWPGNDKLKDPLSCRSEGCDSRSRIRCMKCNVYLCLNNLRNCFLKFHKK